MEKLQQALSRLDEIETAIAEGDLEAANAAAQDLKPLLISNNIDELVALRERINTLSLGVVNMQSQGVRQLRALKHTRGGVEVYQALSTVN